MRAHPLFRPFTGVRFEFTVEKPLETYLQEVFTRRESWWCMQNPHVQLYSEDLTYQVDQPVQYDVKPALPPAPDLLHFTLYYFNQPSRHRPYLNDVQASGRIILATGYLKKVDDRLTLVSGNVRPFTITYPPYMLTTISLMFWFAIVLVPGWLWRDYTLLQPDVLLKVIAVYIVPTVYLWQWMYTRDTELLLDNWFSRRRRKPRA